MSPYTVAQMIESGERLQKPSNAACSEEMYENLVSKATLSWLASYFQYQEESGLWDLNHGINHCNSICNASSSTLL